MSAGRNSRAFEDSEESSVDTMLSMPIAVPAITEQHLSVDASECPKEGEIEDLPCELLASMLSMPSWTEAGSEFALGASAPSESGSSDGAEDCWNLDSKGKAVSPAQEARLADAQAAAQARYGSSSSSSSSSISSRGGEKPKQGWMAQKVKTFFAGSGTGSRAAGGHMLDGAGSDRWGSKNSKRRSSTGIFGFGSGRSGGGGGGGGSGGGGGGRSASDVATTATTGITYNGSGHTSNISLVPSGNSVTLVVQEGGVLGVGLIQLPPNVDTQ
jgi:hypothetical protein